MGSYWGDDNVLKLIYDDVNLLLVSKFTLKNHFIV